MKPLHLSFYTFIAVGIVTLCSQGCSYIRVYKAMTAGNVHVVSAPDTIPFEYRNNKIVIKGSINDNEYDFVVDTGAPTIIWDEVATELQLPKIKASITATDANGDLKFRHI